MTRAFATNDALRPDDRPLLRAPPFPGARPLGRPTLRAGGPDPTIAPRIDALARTIASARVGGSFWAAPTDEPADCDPWSSIADTDEIIAPPNSETAMLAVAAGRTVIDPHARRRIVPAALLSALATALARFDYACPFTGEAIDITDWISLLADWRRQIDANRTLAAVTGVAAWKRSALSAFLWSDTPPTIGRTVDPATVTAGKAFGIWPSRTPASAMARAGAAGISVARIEDGFVRSIGLGAHLHPPRSIVVDFEGIYYDPNGPSALETLLQSTRFDTALVARAAALRRMIVAARLTKYGVGRSEPALFPAGRRRVLVVGQVEDDLSVRLGGAGIRTNLDLLRRARQAEPDAFIVFKPHPDVAAGLRKGHVAPAVARGFADVVLPRADITALLDHVDVVHVLTSLTGFEALLRGRQVVVHGQPFYAGWGLTIDRAPPIARRTRRLTLDELVAGALILYPRYLDPMTDLPCPPEIVVRRHRDDPPATPRPLHRLRAAQGRAGVAWRDMREARP